MNIFKRLLWRELIFFKNIFKKLATLNVLGKEEEQKISKKTEFSSHEERRNMQIFAFFSCILSLNDQHSKKSSFLFCYYLQSAFTS